MIEWLKTAKSGLVVAGLAFMAFLAAAAAGRHKAAARKWKDRAVEEKESDVADAADRAKAALGEARVHDRLARDAGKATKARLDKIGGKNESMADLVSSWRKPRSK